MAERLSPGVLEVYLHLGITPPAEKDMGKVRIEASEDDSWEALMNFLKTGELITDTKNKDQIPVPLK